MTNSIHDIHEGMVNVAEYALQFLDDQNREHELHLSLLHRDDGEDAFLTVLVKYTKPTRYSHVPDLVAEWQASRRHASRYGQAGAADVGGGDRRLPAEWRGSGLGTLLQSLLTAWVKDGEPVRLAEIIFASGDVCDSDKKIDAIALARRQRFWEKFGFDFELSVDGSFGMSREKFSDTLTVPELKLANDRGWKMKLPDRLIGDFGLSVIA